MMANPELARGRIISAQGRKDYTKMWTILSEKLNSLGLGEKSIEKWQKSWSDYKYNLKKKAAEIEKSQTGGESESFPSLTDFELKVLGIYGESDFDIYSNTEPSTSQKLGINKEGNSVIPKVNRFRKRSHPPAKNDQASCLAKLTPKLKSRKIQENEDMKKIYKDMVKILNNVNHNTSLIATSLEHLVEEIRAKRWLIACNREDLLEKLNNIHKSHRLCGDHFEAKMFTNHLRNRLNFNAVPTLFSILVENSSKAEDHSYARPPLIYPESVPEKKYVPTTVDDTKIANSHLLSPPTSIQTCFTVSDTETTSPSVDVVRTASTQTSTTLSFNSPRKRKYGDLIKNLIKENQSLRQNAENLTVTCKLIKIELP
ncbi:unnamed protein product [Ceutorhynchus assimilis]|uniref:Regulatory protein zeste n=1 Tax=Ceutorhynchus assimilis TaxID=467358 RepID=A0A9N9MFD8_9CUCU|nr:unnamed protein product [Ceutorhynchus assimilis]